MPAKTIKDVVMTLGFSKAMDKCIKYSTESREPSMVYANFDVQSRRPYFNATLVNPKSKLHNYYFGPDGKDAEPGDVMMMDTVLTFDVHTEGKICFDEQHIENTDGAGVIAIAVPKKGEAKSLFWRPKEKYDRDFAEELANKLSVKGTAQVVKELQKYGYADAIDFELVGDVWFPKRSHERRLEKFDIHSFGGAHTL